MICGTSVCLLKSVLVVAGLAAVGMGGYNLATTGCPLGSCSASENAAATTAAAHQEPAGGCPMGGCSEGEALEAEVVLTAAPAGPGHCDGGASAGCPMSGTMAVNEQSGECPMGAHCDEMDPADCPPDCQMECPHEVPADQVAKTDPVSEKGAG